jgi:hypothetical protein
VPADEQSQETAQGGGQVGRQAVPPGRAAQRGTREGPEREADVQIEISIGAVSEDEMQRLKWAAERHSDRDDEEGRAESDAT